MNRRESLWKVRTIGQRFSSLCVGHEEFSESAGAILYGGGNKLDFGGCSPRIEHGGRFYPGEKRRDEELDWDNCALKYEGRRFF